jgi:DNA-binding response OmpR family regulator
MSDATPFRVMIVEDEALLAMQLESFLEDAGHEVVGWATSAAEARELCREARPDLAFVDLQLADGCTGMELARDIEDEDATVVFVTANSRMLPEDLCGAVGVISKPYSVHGIEAALRYLHEGLRGPPPLGDVPTSLTLAPHVRDRWTAG